MSEAGDDVLGKLDALMKRHQPASEADIPVLTDVVAPSELDLDAIPMLTEEVGAEPAEERAVVEELPDLAAGEAPLPELEALEFTPPEPEREPEPEPEEFPHLEIAPAAQPSAPPTLEFEMPPGARYVSLEAQKAPAPEAPLPAPVLQAVAPQALPPQALSEETIQHIADIIKDDVAKVLDTQLQQALAQQLQSSLHVALDRALSSMLDQFIATIEEVVRSSIADELQKQLAPFKRPKTPE
jgi:hypothetical protein